MNKSILWDNENEIASYGIVVPKWIDPDLSCYDVAAIIQGGCDSGAYMPAVTYFDAAQTMAKHGDDVLDYIDSTGVDIEVPRGQSWSGIAVFFLSTAVELWASSIESELLHAVEAEMEPNDDESEAP